MSTVELTLAYDGDALREGRMDVRELAPAMLAVGEMFEAARAVVAHDDGEVRVFAKAGTPKGSFPITLEVVKPLIQQVGDWLAANGQTISSAKDLAETVGLAAGGVAGAWQFLRWLRNRKVTETTRAGDGQIFVKVSDGHSIQINNVVFNVAMDPLFRRAVANVVAPLSRPGIDILETRETASAKGTELATKEDVSTLMSASAALGEDAEVLGEHAITLEIVRVHFRRKHRWQLSDGKRGFGVEILDEDFLRRVESRAVRFGKGDMLRVLLRTEQRREPDGRLLTAYYVTKVLGDPMSSKGGTQTRLLPPE